jgi:hypothetical protein
MPHDEPHIPARLADALRRAHEPAPMSFDALDDTVMAAARDELERRSRPLVFRAAPWLAAAALIAIGVTAWMIWQPRTGAPAPASGLTIAREDIDASGRVDILDAFVIARTLEGGDRPDPAWDLNSDGSVDDADVDLVAAASVKLKGSAS